MLYLFLDTKRIKLLALKKSVMGQYEAFFFDKQHQIELLKNGQITNTDLIASAIKEGLNSFKSGLKEKDVFLILPQESFSFLRASIPSDIASSALYSFIKDKARSEWKIDLDNYYFDYLTTETNHQSTANLFAFKKDVFAQYQEAFALINLKVTNLLPETLTYFKLFEKTLRKEKLEKIFYTIFEKDSLSGYLYDSNGLISPKRWRVTLPPESRVETVLKEQVAQFDKQGYKLSRLILSGQSSENIRQDTFTKEVGVWTNPLKRIVSNFYQDYLKQLITSKDRSISLLKFDVCFGAFIFSIENKQFSLLKKSSPFKIWTPKKISLPKIVLPIKEIIIFIFSFSLSFLAFLLITQSKINLSFVSKLTKPLPLTKKPSPTPTKTPSPTPTPSFKKENLKIKILNGAGIVGKAAELKNILDNKNYGEVLTGNADNFEFKQTIIQVKANRQEAAEWIKKDLEEVLPKTKIKIETLDEKTAADLILIIGKDFK